MSHISWNLMAALQPVVLQQENGKSETERRTASVRISREAPENKAENRETGESVLGENFLSRCFGFLGEPAIVNINLIHWPSKGDPLALA